MFRSCGEIDIGHNTFVHTTLDTKVEHRFFLTVLNTADSRKVALLVISLDALDDVRRQVLEGSLRVARHKFLAIDEDFLDLFTINLDGTVVTHLGTRQTLDEFLYNRAFGCTKRARVIHKGVSLKGYLRGMSRYCGALQHDSIGLKRNGACMIILTVLNGDFLTIGLETYIRNLKGIVAIARRLEGETTI